MSTYSVLINPQLEWIGDLVLMLHIKTKREVSLPRTDRIMTMVTSELWQSASESTSSQDCTISKVHPLGFEAYHYGVTVTIKDLHTFESSLDLFCSNASEISGNIC